MTFFRENVAPPIGVIGRLAAAVECALEQALLREPTILLPTLQSEAALTRSIHPSKILNLVYWKLLHIRAISERMTTRPHPD